jgi:mannose-6-phosphate isomerase-like protein (cupin superfamily)
MAQWIKTPAVVESAGNIPKRIEEFFGLVNSSDAHISLARMKSPEGWVEPGQTPEFDEYTLVLSGTLRVETKKGILQVGAGQGVHAPKGKWVRYSTPLSGGAEYISACLPAFSPQTVHRDPS